MMKKIVRFLGRHPYYTLFAVSLLTRLFWLGWSWQSVTNDEADLYTSAYLFGRTLKDYFGNTFFLTTGILTPKPSVPVYIGAIPWFFFSVKSVLLAKLPFILLNSLTPLLLYSLIAKLTRDRKLPLFAYLVFNFSPWFSYPSATGYEAVVALFFVLLFFRAALMEPGRMKLPLSVAAGFFAFNSYMGIKPLFPFVLFIGLLFYGGLHAKKIRVASLLKTAVLSFALYGLLIGINYVAPNATLVKREYANMLAYYEKPKIEGMVWFERWTSTGPGPLITAISNKYTIRLREYASKYFTTFNPQYFFQKGDPSSLYGTADLSGLFFMTDFIFFIAGILAISRLREHGLKHLLSLMFIGGIPIALSTTNPTFVLRGIILIIPYTILIALGMAETAKRKWALPLLVFLIAFNTALYATVYRVRIFNLNGEQWKHSIKILSDRINREAPSYRKATFVNIEPQETFLQYAFYEINDPKVIADRMRTGNFSYRNISIDDECPKTRLTKGDLYVFNKENCGTPQSRTETVFTLLPLDRSGKDYFMVRGTETQSKMKNASLKE